MTRLGSGKWLVDVRLGRLVLLASHLRPLKNRRLFFETKYLTHLLTIKVFCIQLVHNALRIFAACRRRGV